MALNSLMPVLRALEQAYVHFNATLFGGMLQGHPIITVQRRGRKHAYGWFGPKLWIDGQAEPPELNISAEDLNRPAKDVLLTLAHEMVHQRAYELGVKDTSRGGRYHNRRFARLAVEVGLCAPREPDKHLGFSAITWGPVRSKGQFALDSLDSNIREGFELARKAFPKTTGTGKMLLFVCGCGFKVRSGRAQLKAMCMRCDTVFSQP